MSPTAADSKASQLGADRQAIPSGRYSLGPGGSHLREPPRTRKFTNRFMCEACASRVPKNADHGKKHHEGALHMEGSRNQGSPIPKVSLVALPEIKQVSRLPTADNKAAG